MVTLNSIPWCLYSCQLHPFTASEHWICKTWMSRITTTFKRYWCVCYVCRWLEKGRDLICCWARNIITWFCSFSSEFSLQSLIDANRFVIRSHLHISVNRNVNGCVSCEFDTPVQSRSIAFNPIDRFVLKLEIWVHRLYSISATFVIWLQCQHWYIESNNLIEIRWLN